MNRFIRFYNQNRIKIWVIIIAIIFMLLILRVLNEIARKRNEENLYNVTQNNTQSTTYTPEKSVISNKKIEKSVYDNHKSTIDEFVNYCNNGEIDKAYQLISEDCKNELYSTVEKFKKNYYEDIFNKKRAYSIQNWTNSIYMVKFMDDMLSTGKVSKDGEIQDYIKVVTEDGEQKLSINGYLGKEQINKEKTDSNIKIKVLSKKSYMDYEIYDIYVENNNDDRLILDNLTEDKTMYLIDTKGTKHYALKNEIDRNSLIIKGKSNKNITLKFDNPYIDGRKIKSINFGGIVIGFGVRDIGAYSIDLY